MHPQRGSKSSFEAALTVIISLVEGSIVMDPFRWIMQDDRFEPAFRIVSK